MRLVHYCPRALVGDGGATRAMWQWASATHAAGCDVAVVYDADLYADSRLRDVAIPIVPLTHIGAGRLRLPRQLSAVLTKDDILVVHSTYIPGNVAAGWSARRHHVPYIVMPHGGYDARSRSRRHRRKRLWLPVERAHLEHALAVHLSFETEAPDAARIGRKARWIIAPTGSDPPPASWDGGTGGYLAWFGRYDIRHKGLDVLVQAMRRLPSRDRRCLRVHGRPSENSAEDIETLVVTEGIADLVSVGGPVSGSEKADFLRRAAAYVHPSRWESHSHALVEALSSGVPSVVSASCSVASQLRAADAAIVVEATPDAIAQGISAVLSNPQHYSDRAKHFVQTSLAWPTIIKAYLEQINHFRRMVRKGK
jgi:glycosyltransferase involved in cell wall biosynthesis